MVFSFREKQHSEWEGWNQNVKNKLFRQRELLGLLTVL